MKEKEPKQEHCDCKRAYKEALSGICELCWDEKYPTKQDPLEEAAKEYSERHLDVSGNLGKYLVKAVFQEGANYQAERMYSDEPKPTIKQVDYVAKKQERMYSEEEVRELLTQRSKHWGTSVEPFDKLLLRQDLEWFEQNKKKEL